MWSSPMRATAATSGVTALVASKRPPSPTSTTAAPTRSRAMCRSPTSVANSKYVSRSLSPPSSCQGHARRTSSIRVASAASSMGRPSTWMRSWKRTRCGDV